MSKKKTSSRKPVRAKASAPQPSSAAATIAALIPWRIVMSKEQVAGIVRAVCAAVGGYFVGKGLLDGATMETIAGAVATLATAVWSVVSKK